MSCIGSPLAVGVVQVDYRKAEEESHSGVLQATARTQRGAAWAAHTSSDFGCSALSSYGPCADRAGFGLIPTGTDF